MKIRELTKASEKDAFLLSIIAYQAKSFWDYPSEWLQLWKDDLTVSVEYLNENHTFILDLDGHIIGFCVIKPINNSFEIDHCWIHPDHIGQGYGARLLSHVLSQPAFIDKEFTVLSDPNAQGFYKKFGFITIKNVEGKPKGRMLPFMRMVNRLSKV